MVKFRAWDKEEKEWLSIRTIGFDDDGSLWYLQAWDDNESDIDPPYFEDDLGVKWELIQSTGLKDKNGVDIYIGDILEYEMVMGHGWYENGKDVVIYDEKELRIKMSKRNNDTLNRVVAIGCEVVGNIYEHPHLLEGDNE